MMPIVKPIPKHTHGLSKIAQLKSWFGRRQWVLWQDFQFDLSNGLVVIPKGFIFDFASVPRPLWPVMNPVGLLLIGSILHDYTYRYGYLPLSDGAKLYMDRAEADRLLRDVTIEQTGIKSGAWLAWAGVRIGGKLAYKGGR